MKIAFIILLLIELVFAFTINALDNHASEATHNRGNIMELKELGYAAVTSTFQR